MLKKYQNFYKISKTQQCNFYEANLRDDMNKVLIKRIKSPWSWNEMLKSKSLKIQSQSTSFPKAIEIFKHNGSYFVVYEQPYGPALWFADSSIKLDLVDFYTICNTIINSLIKLRKQVPNMYVYPEWIFLHRNTVKIAHFQPYFETGQKTKKQQGHVFMYDLMRGSIKKSQIEPQQTKRIKNFNFNLGYIAYHLITGDMTEWRQDQEDYYTKVKLIQKIAKNKIITETDDPTLAEFVHTLLTFTSDPNDFYTSQEETQALDQFKSYINRKMIECKGCKHKESFRIVEFSLQKMKLQNKMSKLALGKKKKCYRACCSKKFQNQPNPEDQNSDKFRVIENYGKDDKDNLQRMNRIKTENGSSQKKMKLKSESSKKIVSRHKINSSCVLPELKSDRKDSILIQRMRTHQNRSTMFRKSLHGVGTIKSYLRTEY